MTTPDIKSFSQALPILEAHGVTLESLGADEKTRQLVYRVGTLEYDKGGILALARELAARDATQAAATDPPDGWGPQSLVITLMRRDGGTQARVGLNEDTVQDYAELMRDGRWDFSTIKRPIVCWDEDGYWLADGFHRIEAAQRAGLVDYPVEVLRGGKRAAILRAAGANADHGLRRTNADKRRAVELLLRDEEWRQWSDRKIAEACAVDHKTVADVRRSLSGEVPQMPETRTVERNGTTYQMTPAAPKPKISERPGAERAGGQRAELSTPDPKAPPTPALDRQAQIAAGAPTIPDDIRTAAGKLELLIESRPDGFLLHWPGENTALYATQTPEMAREWLTTEAPTKALDRLHHSIPKDLERAGYFWWSALPPTIAHNDGWRGDAPTTEGALGLARARLIARAAEQPAPSAWKERQERITPSQAADMAWYDQVEAAAVRALEAADHGSRAAAVQAALALADLLAGDDLTTLADQLDDATYEALACYRRDRSVPALESEVPA